MNPKSYICTQARRLQTGPFPNSLFSWAKPDSQQMEPWCELLNLNQHNTNSKKIHSIFLIHDFIVMITTMRTQLFKAIKTKYSKIYSRIVKIKGFVSLPSI